MRIVHIVPHHFLPAEDGGRQKTLGIASALAALSELHIVNFDDNRPMDSALPAEPTPLRLTAGRHASFHELRRYSRRVLFPRSAYLKLRHGHGLWRWRSATPRDARVHQLIHNLAPDVIVADDTSLARFSVLSNASRRIVHTHNHESTIWHELSRRYPEKRNWAKLAATYPRIERELLPMADQVWVVREADRHVYAGVNPNDVYLVPNALPDSSFDDQDTVGTAGRALFVGSLWYPPNAQAADYLAGLAQRWQHNGSTWQIRIAGRGAPSDLESRLVNAPGIAALGFVDNLKSEARAAAAILIPLTYGSGTKVKTIEAMALGRPIITTPTGAEGLDLVDGFHALIRAPGKAFDEAAEAVLRTPADWAHLGRNARDLARRRFSQASLDAVVARALETPVRQRT